jgi:AcrR family transcriptional regulator
MQQPDYDRRLDEALDNAEALFAKKGFHGASMRDIARAAGVSVAGLYYYLPSKQEALYLVCNRIFDRLEAGTRRLGVASDPIARLESFVREHVRFMIGNPDAYRVLLHDMEALQGSHGRDLHARRRNYFSSASRLVGSLGVKPDYISARFATAALFGILNWAPMWYRRDLDGNVDELGRKVLAIFLGGVASPAALEVAS